MAAQDKIRLTGLLRKSPAQAGLFYLPFGPATSRLVIPIGFAATQGVIDELAELGIRSLTLVDQLLSSDNTARLVVPGKGHNKPVARTRDHPAPNVEHSKEAKLTPLYRTTLPSGG
jgi:hypothetical protein